LTVPTTPLELLLGLCVLPPLLLRLCELRLRLCVLPPLRLCVLRFAVEPPERFEPLLDRAEPLRVERALAPDELALALLFDAAEPFGDLLLVCLLPEALPPEALVPEALRPPALLFAAIVIPLRSKSSSDSGYPLVARLTRLVVRLGYAHWRASGLTGQAPAVS
jgi:hypothetical protein